MGERDLGTQPFDLLMEAWGLSNTDLVNTSPEQLTHKQVRRARSGRQLTLKMMMLNNLEPLRFSIYLKINCWMDMHVFNAVGVKMHAQPMRREKNYLHLHWK